MTLACVFAIGSGHSSTESHNVLVQLYKACRFAHLGEIGNHTILGSHQSISYNKEAEKNGGWSWINEGQGNLGTGSVDQAKANCALILELDPMPTDVVLVGHSRGGVLALRTAELLSESTTGSGINCHLFLFDPVQRDMGGEPRVHDNVKTILVLVAEDDPMGQVLKLLAIKRASGEQLATESFIRIPGTHGTMTQVYDGNPIGQIAYMMALRFLTRKKVPSVSAISPTRIRLLEQYMQIHRVNPRDKKGHRSIKDWDTSGSKAKRKHAGKTRMKQLLAVTQTNRSPFRDSQFFINEHHHKLFLDEYSELCMVVDLLEKGSTLDWGTAMNVAKTDQKYAAQLRGLKTRLHDTYEYLVTDRKLLFKP